MTQCLLKVDHYPIKIKGGWGGVLSASGRSTLTLTLLRSIGPDFYPSIQLTFLK